ncbi:MAG TPA: NaeI family type II restriction endonuclease [Solirubrobacterales bacterium]|nr:NaeI family type II restriction endonuclease [Solirubrobacterales bacterium]
MLELFPAETEPDQALEEVWSWLQDYPRRTKDGLDLEATFSRAIRQAIDEVIDGSRTGRYRYEELESQEKAYIGTRIEIVVRTEFELEPEGKLDTVIAGHPVDFKWSMKGGWMIPTEATGELCLLLKGDEVGGAFSVGLVRCTEDRLNKGANKDGKRTLSKAGRAAVRWLVKDGHLPASFLSTLDAETREAVLAQPPGQARVREFFKRVTRRPVPREVIPTLAVQEDPMRRVRQDKHADGLAGLKILSGHYKVSKEAATLLGYELTKRDYLAVPVEELRTLPSELQRRLKL